MIYRNEINDGTEVEIALQWRGTREDLPEELRNASREEITEYLMEKYDGRKEYAIEEDWFTIIDTTCYSEQDEDWTNGVDVETEDELFDFTPDVGVIEYWCRHESTLYGEVECDENGVITNIDDLDSDDKHYCVQEGVFFGE